MSSIKALEAAREALLGVVEGEVDVNDEAVRLHLERAAEELRSAITALKNTGSNVGNLRMVVEGLKAARAELEKIGVDRKPVYINAENFRRLQRLCKTFGFTMRELMNRIISDWLEMIADANWEPILLDPELPQKLTQRILGR